MSGMWSDLRYATRSLWRDRAAFIIAVTTLAVGLAANTTVFSLVRALEFPDLPYPNADRIVFLETDNAKQGIRGMLVSVPDALSLRETVRTLDTISVTADTSAVIDGRGGRRHEGGRQVDTSFFSLFGVSPMRGRALHPSDDDTAIVVSERLWRLEHGDPWREDRSLRVDGRDRRIVGVMPGAFDADADFWLPWTPPSTGIAREDRRYPVFARLGGSHTLDDLNAELKQRSQALEVAFASNNAGWTMVGFRLAQLHGRDDRSGFFRLQAAVVLVLLVTCANIANVLLARNARQRRESAVRVALGATSIRLLRAKLAEGLVLATYGGALGLLLALWGIRAVKGLGGFASTLEPTLDLAVLGVSFAAALITGVLCAVLPAWSSARQPPDAALHNGDTRTSTGRGLGQQALVATQVTGAVVLGVLGTLLIQSWLARQRVDLGFVPAGVVRVSIDEVDIDIIEPLLSVVTSATDVASAAALAPLGRGLDAVTPDYFDTLGIPLLDGRAISEVDHAGAEQVAVVDMTKARSLQSDGRVVGHRLRLGDTADAPVVRIVGIVGPTRRSAMHGAPLSQVYLPMAQVPTPASVQVLARGYNQRAPDPRNLPARLSAVNSRLVVSTVVALEDELAGFTAPLRLMTMVLSAFGLIGALLVALGVFGATRYATSTRMREFAVRAALGSSGAALARLVFRAAAVPAAAGALAGLCIAALAARAIQGYLFGAPPVSGSAFAVVVAMGVVVTAAAVRPAWIASHADPARTLRND